MADPRLDHQVVVTGVGLITPLGDDCDRAFRAIAAGLAGFREVEGEALDAAGLALRRAAPVAEFVVERYLGSGNVRPLDRTARLAAAAAALALEACGWGDLEARRSREIGLVLGTMFGSVHTISAFDLRAQTAGPSYAKPLDFANSVINAAAGQTAIWHGLRGVNSTVAGGPTAGLKAIAAAAELIAGGRAEAVLAGGAEELALEAWVGFARAGLIATANNGNDPVAVPFAAGRSGFLLGEGAAILALESRASAARRGARIAGSIAGHGSTFDPSRGSDVTRQSDALARAIRSALEAARLAPGDVDLVSVSASGDPSRDRAEARAIASAIGPKVPIMAIKANLGESLGAAGALQAAAALLASAHGEIPGIAGLGEIGEDIPLQALRATSRQLDVRIALVTALGLDGNAEAMVLRGGDA